MSLKRTIASRLPTAALDIARALQRRPLKFDASPNSWVEASQRSSGYDSGHILDRVAKATRAVIAGEATYERDSVTFHDRSIPFQIAAPVLQHALRHDGLLEVIDYGGSLGNAYRHLRPYLWPLKQVRWHVIEQPLFVAAGKAEFTTAELNFFETTDDLPAPAATPLALLSSVLQYLPDPHAALRAVVAAGASTIVIDRTALSDEAEDRISIQTVPSSIYPASYPCWILSLPRLLDRLGPEWLLRVEFSCPEGVFFPKAGPRFEFKGLILERSTALHAPQSSHAPTS